MIRKCILTVALKTNLRLPCCYMCCISFNMNILQSLVKFKTCIIKIPKHSLFLFLALNVVFITVYHVKAVQDDISAKTVPI